MMESHCHNADLPQTSLAGWIFQQLKRFAADKDRIAQIFADDGSSWTYEKFLQNSVHVAAGLKNVGMNPGDMVSIVARNSHELYALVFGCIMSGIVVTPSVPELSPNELKQNFLLVDARFVIAGASSLRPVEAAVASLSPAPRVFEVQQLFRDTVFQGARVDPAKFTPFLTNDPKSHIFLCLFSSGTTGKQKAVAMNDYGRMRMMNRPYPSNGHIEVIANCSQINWTSWWYATLFSFQQGCTRIFFDKNHVVDILNAIHTFKPTSFHGFPYLLASMVHEIEKYPGRWDLSSIHTFAAGGDIFSKVAHEELSKKLKLNIYQIYGSTEAGSVLKTPLNSPIVYGSCGKPLKKIKLVDLDTGKEITEPNTSGEIRVQWSIFSHYVKNSEETADSFDENGWFKMGDVAQFDEQGNYFIVGRVKEIFKYHGYQIAPAELEDILEKMPGVKEAVVIGKPVGQGMGCLPTAFIIKTEDSKITEKCVHDHLKQYNLHDSKRLRGGVIFTDHFPRNANGKVLKGKLKDLL